MGAFQVGINPASRKSRDMRTNYFAVALCIMTASLSGCVIINKNASRPIKMERGSAVDLKTQFGAADLIWLSMQRLGCPQTDTIYPETMEKSTDFQAGTGYVITGYVKERWIARGCNMQVPYIVDIKANKQSEYGSDIYIRREHGGN